MSTDITLWQGDCLEQMTNIPDGSVDMVLTDSPYSSGGLFAGDRKASTRAKYTDDDYNGAARFPNFSGDNNRGIVVWDKRTSRPVPNRFRNDCEYVVWGTNGPRKTEYVKGVFVGPGCYRIPGVISSKKHHQTEKPVELLEKLLAICPEDGIVFDPFMGSGSTGVACANTGRRFIGIELESSYFWTAKQRIETAIVYNE